MATFPRPAIWIVAAALGTSQGMCAPADGTYSLDLTGAMRAHVSGLATGEQTSKFSDVGQSYKIVLHFPRGTEFGSPSREEFLLFSWKDRPRSARYRAVDVGDNEAPDQLATLLQSGSDQTSWSTAGGEVDISARHGSTSGRAGSFTLKFVRGLRRPVGATDTLFVTGKFDIP
jgi:hypothetical protein